MSSSFESDVPRNNNRQSRRKSGVATPSNVDIEMYFRENTYGIKTKTLEQEV